MRTAFDISVVVPCYNEQEVLPKTVKLIEGLFRHAKLNHELILVDNGSYDNTRKVILNLMKKNRRIKLVVVKKNVGYGFGVISGCMQAKGRYLTYMVADLQVHPRDLVRVYNEIIKHDEKTIVKTKRVERNDGLVRLITSKAFNLLMYIFFGRLTSDINGTPKIMLNSVYRKINPTYKNSFLDAEILVKSKKLGLNIVEIPTKSPARSQGSSKVKVVRESLLFLRDMIVFRLKTLFG